MLGHDCGPSFVSTVSNSPTSPYRRRWALLGLSLVKDWSALDLVDENVPYDLIYDHQMYNKMKICLSIIKSFASKLLGNAG